MLVVFGLFWVGRRVWWCWVIGIGRWRWWWLFEVGKFFFFIFDLYCGLFYCWGSMLGVIVVGRILIFLWFVRWCCGVRLWIVIILIWFESFLLLWRLVWRWGVCWCSLLFICFYLNFECGWRNLLGDRVFCLRLECWIFMNMWFCLGIFVLVVLFCFLCFGIVECLWELFRLL